MSKQSLEADHERMLLNNLWQKLCGPWQLRTTRAFLSTLALTGVQI